MAKYPVGRWPPNPYRLIALFGEDACLEVMARELGASTHERAYRAINTFEGLSKIDFGDRV
jgi:hypothetical protein